MVTLDHPELLGLKEIRVKTVCLDWTEDPDRKEILEHLAQLAREDSPVLQDRLEYETIIT